MPLSYLYQGVNAILAIAPIRYRAPKPQSAFSSLKNTILDPQKHGHQMWNTFCNFKPQIWLETITSRDAKSACVNDSWTSCDVILFSFSSWSDEDHIWGFFLLRWVVSLHEVILPTPNGRDLGWRRSRTHDCWGYGIAFVWNDGWGMELHFFRPLKFQNSEPETWRKS